MILGVASSGPHSNGYSLIRHILKHVNADLGDNLGAVSLADALMAPTTLYVKPMLDLLGQLDVHAMAHITGGGITENIIRVVPEGLGLAIDASTLVLPPVFDWLKRSGAVANEEMWRTFNCGVGFTLLLDAGDVAMAKRLLAGHGLATREIGQVVVANGDERVRIG